jgi:hypothetical protein
MALGSLVSGNHQPSGNQQHPCPQSHSAPDDAGHCPPTFLRKNSCWRCSDAEDLSRGGPCSSPPLALAFSSSAGNPEEGLAWAGTAGGSSFVQASILPQGQSLYSEVTAHAHPSNRLRVLWFGSTFGATAHRLPKMEWSSSFCGKLPLHRIDFPCALLHIWIIIALFFGNLRHTLSYP